MECLDHMASFPGQDDMREQRKADDHLVGKKHTEHRWESGTKVQSKKIIGRPRRVAQKAASMEKR